MSDRPSRDQVVSVRFTEDERAALEAQAASVGVVLSELIRRASLALLFPPPPVPSAGTFTTTGALARVQFEEGGA